MELKPGMTKIEWLKLSKDRLSLLSFDENVDDAIKYINEVIELIKIDEARQPTGIEPKLCHCHDHKKDVAATVRKLNDDFFKCPRCGGLMPSTPKQPLEPKQSTVDFREEIYKEYEGKLVGRNMIDEVISKTIKRYGTPKERLVRWPEEEIIDESSCVNCRTNRSLGYAQICPCCREKMKFNEARNLCIKAAEQAGTRPEVNVRELLDIISGNTVPEGYTDDQHRIAKAIADHLNGKKT